MNERSFIVKSPSVKPVRFPKIPTLR